MPTIVGGQYLLLLLRVGVGENKESENNLQILGVGGGATQNGAAASFPMPTLKIFVGVMSDKLAWIKNGLITTVDNPQNSLNKNPQRTQQNIETSKEDVRVFAWRALDEAEIYLLEVFDENESKLLSAYLPAPQSSYRLPLQIRDKFKNKQISWRVSALKKNGALVARTESQRRN